MIVRYPLQKAQFGESLISQTFLSSSLSQCRPTRILSVFPQLSFSSKNSIMSDLAGVVEKGLEEEMRVAQQEGGREKSLKNRNGIFWLTMYRKQKSVDSLTNKVKKITGPI